MSCTAIILFSLLMNIWHFEYFCISWVSDCSYQCSFWGQWKGILQNSEGRKRDPTFYIWSNVVYRWLKAIDRYPQIEDTNKQTNKKTWALVWK